MLRRAGELTERLRRVGEELGFLARRALALLGLGRRLRGRDMAVLAGRRPLARHSGVIAVAVL